MLTAVCVLRSGGEYGPHHVAWLKRQLDEHLPGVRVVCFSDADVDCERVQLVHTYPGWWSKMELFRTDALPGDVLYFDLDTVIVRGCAELSAVGSTVGLDDVNTGNTFQSSVMYLTEDDRRFLWAEWQRFPAAHMARCGGHGDQKFIGETLGEWRSWQKVLPGALVSYKNDIRRNNLEEPPAAARVVFFHGRPRPWQVNATWIPKLT